MEAAVCKLKAEAYGRDRSRGSEAGEEPTELGLIDECRIYLHSVLLGLGIPFFAAARSPLRLVSSKQMDDNVLQLTYAPA